jgi:hypothetical protein
VTRTAVVAKNSNRGSKPGERRGGRKVGTPNKATAQAREAIASFIDGNAERLQGWLDQIATADGPKAAFQCFTDLLEFHVPKLARTEVTGEGGKPLQIVVSQADERL